MAEEQARDELIAHLQLAYALAQDGDLNRAQAILEQCTAAADDLAAQANVAFYQGLVAREMDDLEAAAVFLAEAQVGYETASDRYQAGVAASYRGRLTADAGRLIPALEHHYAAFQHFLAEADLMGIGNELARMGLVLRQLHRHQEALDCFRQALEAHQAAGHWRSVLVDRFNLASTAQDLGQRPLAQEHVEAARTLARQLDDLLNLARADCLLAGLAADAGNPTEALERYVQARRQVQEIGDAKLLADITLGMGLTRYALGELAAAGENLAGALERYIHLEDVEGQAVAFSNLGLVHLANGNLEKAEQCFAAAIEYQQKRGDAVEVARQQGNLGLVLRARGKWLEAEQIHRQALHLLAEAGDTAGQATQRVNLASLAYLHGRFNEAEHEYQDALALYAVVGHRQGQADVLANLGNIAHARSQWEKALNYYQESLVRYRQIGHRRGEAGLLANIGVIYRELGRWPEAIHHYEQATALYQGTADRPGEAATLNNLALAHRLIGDVGGAVQALERAQGLYEEIGDKRGQAAILDNVGLLHQESGVVATAVDYHQQALAIYRQLEFQAGIMASLGNLGRAVAARGKYQVAGEHFQQAITLACELDDSDAQARLLVARGDLYHCQKEWSAARTDYEAALALIEEQRFSLVLRSHRESFLGRERQSVYIRLVKLLVRQGSGKRAWWICEQSRGRTFLDQLAQSRLPLPVGVDSDWWQKLQSTRDQIVVLTHEEYSGESPVPVPNHQKQALLAEAQRRLEAILDDAPDSVAHWAELWRGRPISYRDLRQHLSLA